MLTISVIGTGAIGGYYGAKLARGGQDVHFLLHRDYEYVKEHGLYVKSCDGDFRLDKGGHLSAGKTLRKLHQQSNRLQRRAVKKITSKFICIKSICTT